LELFSPELELEIIAAVIQNPKEYQDLVEVLDSNLFVAEGYQWIVKKLLSYFKRFNKLPGSGYFLQEARTIPKAAEREKVETVLRVTMSHQSTMIEYAEDKYREYLGLRVLDAGVKEAYQDDGGRDLTQTLKVLENTVMTVRSSFKSKVVGIDYAEQYQSREQRRGYLRKNPDAMKVLKFGIPQLDKVVKKEEGTVTAYLAPFKRYKSIVLVHCGFAGLLQGFNVLHVVYENTIEQTAARYDARFTGLDYNRVKIALKTREERINTDLIMKRVGSWANRLKILKGIPKRTSIADIETELRKLEATEGWVPEIEIWDYSNLIGSPGIVEERHQQEAVIWGLQNRAQERGRSKIEITACQAKMSGVNAEDLTNEHWAKSIGIPQALDNGVAVNQSESERIDGIIRLSPLILRDEGIDADSRHILLNMELTRMCVDKRTDDLWEESEDNFVLED